MLVPYTQWTRVTWAVLKSQLRTILRPKPASYVRSSCSLSSDSRLWWFLSSGLKPKPAADTSEAGGQIPAPRSDRLTQGP